jgi:hypothetical protein
MGLAMSRRMPPHGVDQGLEAAHVDHGVVVELEAEGLGDGLLDRRQARLLAGVQVGVLLAEGVDAVQHALAVVADVAVGVERAERRRLGERHALHVAREAEQHRPARRGVDGGHVDGVGPQPLAVRGGVRAEQQDVVAPVLGLGVAAAAQHLAEVRGPGERGGGDGGDQPGDDGGRKREHGQPEARLALQAQRPREPPRVEQEEEPAHEEHPHQDAERRRDQRREQQADGEAAEGEEPDHDEQEQRGDAAEDPQRDPAHPLIARERLHRAGHQRGHQDEPDGAAHLHLFCGVRQG